MKTVPPLDQPLDPPELPPPGFDPVHNPLHRADLERYWLPECPDSTREPALYAHWREMFAGTPTFVWANCTPENHTSHTGSVSRNWSGAYIRPHTGGRFRRVTGHWVVPVVQDGIGPNPDNLPFRYSAWIGIDGGNAWTRSMPQVGSAQTPGQPATLWIQWWVRNGPQPPWDITGVELRPTDPVMCNLSVISPSYVRFHVKNCRSGEFATVGMHGSVPTVGSSAEWVVERPASPRDGRAGPLFPLPDYGSVEFNHAAAQATPAPGSATPARTSWTRRRIALVQALPSPSRAAIISTPSWSVREPGTIRVHYQKR